MTIHIKDFTTEEIEELTRERIKELTKAHSIKLRLK